MPKLTAGDQPQAWIEARKGRSVDPNNRNDTPPWEALPPGSAPVQPPCERPPPSSLYDQLRRDQTGAPDPVIKAIPTRDPVPEPWAKDVKK